MSRLPSSPLDRVRVKVIPMTAINGKLVVQLSLLGLVMGVATVFLIPSKIEPLFWLVIFVFCAITIARRAPGKYFLHGFLVSLLNCVWITGSHILLFGSYLPRHPNEAAMMARMPAPDWPRLMMLMTGPLVGIASGIVLGMFAFVAAKIRRRSTAERDLRRRRDET
jgi:hypothetical protein